MMDGQCVFVDSDPSTFPQLRYYLGILVGTAYAGDTTITVAEPGVVKVTTTNPELVRHLARLYRYWIGRTRHQPHAMIKFQY